MTKCPICNKSRENKEFGWCDECFKELLKFPDEDYSNEIAEWAANRAREFERAKIEELLKIAADLIVACDCMADWQLGPSEKEPQDLLQEAIMKYKKE